MATTSKQEKQETIAKLMFFQDEVLRLEKELRLLINDLRESVDNEDEVV